MAQQEERKYLIDEHVETPEGIMPRQLHIYWGQETKDYAEQYVTALHVARGVPFNLHAIQISDPLVMILSNQLGITDGSEAIRQASMYYENWTNEILTHAWMLAFLADNVFTNEPTPYDPPKAAPGVPIAPAPRYNLSNPVERRLKQALDIMNTSLEFQSQVMRRINNAIAQVFQQGDEETDQNGFQPVADSGNGNAVNVTNNNDNGDRPADGQKIEAQSPVASAVGEVSEVHQPTGRKNKKV